MGKDEASLVLRVSFGLMMVVGHGWNKLVKFEDLQHTFPDPLGIGSRLSLGGTVLAEVLFPLLVVVGFRTRLACLPVIFTMVIAAFVHHGGDPFAKREMALLYLAGYTAIALIGPGKYSWERFRKGS